MNEEIKIIIKAATDSAQKAIKEVSKELNGLSKTAKSSSGKIGAAFNGIAKGVKIAGAAIAAMGAALILIGKRSLEFQKEQARLNAAFEAAGMSAAQAAKAYDGLYRFLGDSDQASEAAAHLAKITNNQQYLAEWTKIAQGVYATFGKSLPIESLTEAANETMRVGKVTGVMADALNWAGVSEDAFNAKLAQTNSLSEREALIRSTLTGIYEDAALAYERANKSLLEYNESQAKVDRAMALAGVAVLPLMTALNNLGSAFFSALTPALNAIIPPIANFINWIAKAIQSVLSFFSAITGKSANVKAFGSIGGAAAGAADSLGSAAQSAKNLGSGMGAAEKAAGGAAKAAEEARRSTQGFDELNIVSSGKTAGGGGGGGGGGSSSPGYGSGGGLVDSAAFGTEVEESEGIANSFSTRIKEIFGDLAEVFDPSIVAWKDAFETVRISWNNAKPDFINGANEIKEGFMTLGTYLTNEFVPNVVNSFSVNIAPIVGDVFGFIIEEAGKAFKWLGEGFNTSINDVIIPALETVETVATDVFDIIGTVWEEHGAGLLDGFSGAFESIRTHIENFYNEIFKPIFDQILVVFGIVWDKGLKPLVETFITAVVIIGTELLTLYNSVIAPVVDWIITNILPPIVNVVEGIIQTVGNIIEPITKSIKGIIKVIQGIIQFVVGVFTGDWNKAWEGIKNIFSGFKDTISGIIDTFIEVLKGIVIFVKDILVAAFKVAWETIKGVWQVVVNFFKGIWDGIVSVFESVGSWFKEKFTAAWNNIKSAWGGVKDWFGGVWDNVKNVFGNVKDWFKQKFTDAWSAIKNVFSNWGSFFGGLWDTIKSKFSSLGTNIASAIGGAVKSGINGVISMIQNTINKAIGLINGAIRLANKLPGVNVGTIKTITLPRLAKGGIVDNATIAMIGERGKEAVVPLENNTEWMDKLADRIAARNNTPTKVILKIGEKELGWATIDAINGITKQTGGLQLAL